MPSFKACLLCGWCDSRGSRVATGMGSEHRPYAHEWVCGCERKEGMRFLSFLLALKSLPGHPGVLCMLVTKHTGPEGFPAFLLGWEAWKPCQWLLGLNREETQEAKWAGRSPTVLRRLHKAQSKFHCATAWLQDGTCGSNQPGQHDGGTAAQIPQDTASQRGSIADPTQCSPFPMHTYLERAVKLKWALLYVLRLMVNVIKLNMSCVEPRSESLWASPHLVFRWM